MHTTSTEQSSSLRQCSVNPSGIAHWDVPWTLTFRENESSDDSPNRSGAIGTLLEAPIGSGVEVGCANRERSNEALHNIPVFEEMTLAFRKRKRIASPHLNLSLFRRPEHTVRLTKCDPLRRLEVEYDLQDEECRVLGHGAFSTVRLAIRRKDGMKVAVKIISKHEALKARRLRVNGRSYVEEWEILKQLNGNQHVVSLLDLFETSEEIQLILEFCPGGELFDAIQRKCSASSRKHQYTEQEAAIITQQLLSALQDIHARGIVHKDVKAENILLLHKEDSHSIHVKLCDFGMARVIFQDADDHSSCNGDVSPATPSRSQSFQLFHSDYYTAPELQLGYGLYDTAVDMFSLGVTVYILLCGFPPVFTGDESDCVVFPSSYWNNISDEAKDFVRSLLAFEPAFRLCAQRALQHPWIVKRPSRVPSKHVLTTDRMRMALLKRRLYQCLKPRSESSFRPNKKNYDNDKYRRHRKRPRRATLIALADLCRGTSVEATVPTSLG